MIKLQDIFHNVFQIPIFLILFIILFQINHWRCNCIRAFEDDADFFLVIIFQLPCQVQVDSFGAFCLQPVY